MISGMRTLADSKIEINSCSVVFSDIKDLKLVFTEFASEKITDWNKISWDDFGFSNCDSEGVAKKLLNHSGKLAEFSSVILIIGSSVSIIT